MSRRSEALTAIPVRETLRTSVRVGMHTRSSQNAPSFSRTRQMHCAGLRPTFLPRAFLKAATRDTFVATLACVVAQCN